MIPMKVMWGVLGETGRLMTCAASMILALPSREGWLIMSSSRRVRRET